MDETSWAQSQTCITVGEYSSPIKGAVNCGYTSLGEITKQDSVDTKHKIEIPNRNEGEILKTHREPYGDGVTMGGGAIYWVYKLHWP